MENNLPHLEAKLYDPETHFGIINDWIKARGAGDDGIPAELLPPVGVVVEIDGEPAACCFAFMAVGVGAAFLEFAISRPGMALTDSKRCLVHAVEALEACLRELDYSVVFVTTRPGMAATLGEHLGYHFLERNSTSLIKTIR